MRSVRVRPAAHHDDAAADGGLYACGDNQFGSLGLGQPPCRVAADEDSSAAAPRRCWRAGGNNGAFSPDGCAVRISGDNSDGVLGRDDRTSRSFIPRANLSLCGAIGDEAAADATLHPAEGRRVRLLGAAGAGERVRDPKFAPLAGVLAAEEILKKNEAYLAAPEAGAHAVGDVGGARDNSGARIHIKAVPERKTDGSRLWTGECDVIPQIDRIGGAIRQISVFFNRTSGQFMSPAATGRSAPARSAAIRNTTTGSSSRRTAGCRGFPQTLADKLDEEGRAPARARRLEEDPVADESRWTRPRSRRPTSCSRSRIRPAPRRSWRR